MPDSNSQKSLAKTAPEQQAASLAIDIWRVAKISTGGPGTDSSSTGIRFTFRNELSGKTVEYGESIPVATLSDYLSYLDWFCGKFDTLLTPNDFQCS
jgi:hypothetical protein